MNEPYDDPIVCCHCATTLHDGDDYYATPWGDLCPDCWDAVTRECKRHVGDTIERC